MQNASKMFQLDIEEKQVKNLIGNNNFIGEYGKTMS